MRRSYLLSGLLSVALAAPAAGQQASAPAALSASDYLRAERMLGATTNPLVLSATVNPNWIDEQRFWYRNTFAQGVEFIVVDLGAGTRARAFDHAALAAALSSASATPVEPFRQPFDTIELSPDLQYVTVNADGRRYTCDRAGINCERAAASAPGRPGGRRNEVASPDGRLSAFIRENNLWVRDINTGAETQLTTDGVQDFGYATNNAGWTRGDNPVLVWSPDSRKIATFQHDGRAVGMMYLVDTAVGHPELEAWRYPLPGDSAIFTIQRVIIDVPTRQVVRLQIPADAHRSTFCDHVYCGGTWADVEWYPDGSHVAFVSSSRDHKVARFRVADAQTGVVRDVFRETVETQFESGEGGINWRVLPASNEVIWFSERDDWGHLYLYDLTTGQVKNQITSGDFVVLEILRVDEANRTIYFLAGGREPGRNPYYQHLYSIRFDGSDLTLLTPEDAHHQVTLSPDGRWFVDRYSTPVVPPVTVVRNLTGRTVVELERADISRLGANGWTPPVQFTVKARDGATDLYGLMYRPTNFDSTRSYPVVNYLYPGPQSGSVGSRAFSAARGDKRAIAELGFIVVEVDAMGTPGRSKSFHDAYYGNMGDNGLPDQMGMIEQLAERHPYMDLDRVGIYGHSGGGFAAADAILRYPDFYKVAVSQAGNHDNRNYEDDWGERYQGLLERNADGTTNYDNQANQLLAQNLRGKLLIAHGTMDSNVPPNNTLALVNELIRYNKDFDLILFPNRSHGFGNEPYMMRRRWDYFVRNLLGAEPPANYEIGAANRAGTR